MEAENTQAKEELKFIGVKIPENLRKLTKAQAALEGRTLSEVVTDALKLYNIEAKKKKKA